VLYLAVGEEHVKLAALSILFLRRFGYVGQVRVVTDAQIWPNKDPEIDIVRVPSSAVERGARNYKTQMNQFAYPMTLLLDADTLPISSINGIWDQLQCADVSARLELPRVQDFIDYYWNREQETRPELELMRRSGLAAKPFYNCGAILFRKTALVDRLFDAWHGEWMRFGGRDQCAFVRAVARIGIPIHVLPRCWNMPPIGFDSVAEAQNLGVKILHFYSGPVRQRLSAFVQELS
jgi:hypothetical protein